MFPNTQLKWTLLLFGLLLVSSESRTCDKGLERRNNSCVDEDECVMPGVCGNHAQCVNTHGSYSCSCNEGFRSTTPNLTAATGQCRDINECLEETHDCSGDLECVNTRGSYNCSCRDGYRPSKLDADCLDTDECRDDPDVCGTNAHCYNNQGGYSCKCHQGYSNYGNGQSKCTEMVHFCLANE